MATQLGTTVKEKSSAIITINFRDEDGQVVEPKSATWTLAMPSGTIVNGRSKVPIVDLASSVQILLTGDDLQISKGKKIQDRVFSVEAVYDSILQDDVNLNDSCIFQIENITGV